MPHLLKPFTSAARPSRVRLRCCSAAANGGGGLQARKRDILLVALSSGVLTVCTDASALSLPQFELPWALFGTNQPDAVSLPRKNLNLNFAVLLMRSTYESVDALDFVAMDQFQVKFWKLRQSEFEPYKLLWDPVPVPVGNLTSPIYFDFITFSQYATISKLIPDAPQVFKEFCEECDGEGLDKPYRVVRRDATLADNRQLPQRLQLAIGRLIYSNLLNGFRNQTFDCPPPLTGKPASPEVLARNVQKILNIFVKNGFAIKSNVSDVSGTIGGTIEWVIYTEVPANLWALQMLQFRRALLPNAFEAFAVQGFLDASGYSSTYKLSVKDSSVEHSWSVTPLSM